MPIPKKSFSLFRTLLCLFLWSSVMVPLARSQTYRDTLSIYFPVGESSYDSTYFDNGTRLNRFVDRFNKVMGGGGNCTNTTVHEISYRVTCSPEGSLAFNRELVKRRFESIISILPQVDSAFVTVDLNEAPWGELLNLLEADKGLSVPYKEETIGIVRAIVDGTASRKDLIRLRGSKPWKYLIKNLFPYLRRFTVVVSVDTPLADISSESASSSLKSLAYPMVQAAPPSCVLAPSTPVFVQVPKNYMIELKTNLLYDIASVLNVSAEVGFLKHYSTELLVTFSPWDYGKETIQFRTLLFQPEFRYWFSEDWTGHFVGLHGHVGWYNFAFGGKTRYQDRNGNTPLGGVGLSYGYALPFNNHWGAEFCIGAGYAYLSYDKFYNIHNGVQFGTGEKHYFGLTKLGASIYYRF